MTENHAEALLEILRVRFKPLRQIVGTDLSEARRHAEALINRIVVLEAEAEMATRMLAASGREQARLLVELELCEARALGLELRVAKGLERLPEGHTAHRGGDLGRTR